MKALFLFLLVAGSLSAKAQTPYQDTLKKFISNYVETHGVLKGHDKTHLAFYPVNETYLVKARLEKTPNSSWFKMETSGLMRPLYRVFGAAHFSLNGERVKLLIYQSQELMNNEQYKTHLFLPFTDLTNGTETYMGGRYIDLDFSAISGNTITLDFNKAYNPYCAYVSGVYNCPIPPKENALPIKIEAGEKAFSKAH